MKAAGPGPDPIDIFVGQRVRALRKQRGLSQAALAAALGVTFQQVQKYERATNRISASMLVRAARALGVRAAELLPPEPETDAAAPGVAHLVHTLVANRGTEALVQAYAKIPSSRLRRALLQLTRALADSDPVDVGQAAA